MKSFKFTHDYLKLSMPVFPTVRGKSSLSYYQIDEHYKVFSPSVKLEVVLVDKFHTTIDSLSNAFIRLDGSYRLRGKLVVCKTIEEYLELLDSFIPRISQFRYKPESVVSVFWLAKTGGMLF